MANGTLAAVNELEEQMSEKIASGYGSLVEDINDVLGRINQSIIQHAENLEQSLKSHVYKLKKNIEDSTNKNVDPNEASSLDKANNNNVEKPIDNKLDSNPLPNNTEDGSNLDVVKKEIEKDMPYANVDNNVENANAQYPPYFDPDIEPLPPFEALGYEPTHSSSEEFQPMMNPQLLNQNSGYTNSANHPLPSNHGFERPEYPSEIYGSNNFHVDGMNAGDQYNIPNANYNDDSMYQARRINEGTGADDTAMMMDTRNQYPKMDDRNNNKANSFPKSNPMDRTLNKMQPNYTPSHDKSMNPFSNSTASNSAQGRCMDNLNDKIKTIYSKTNTYISPYTDRSGYPNGTGKAKSNSGKPQPAVFPTTIKPNTIKDPFQRPPPANMPYREHTNSIVGGGQQYVNYQHHNQKDVEGKKVLKCEECGYATDKNAHMREHIDAVHNKIRPFSCGKCGHSFHRQFNLNIHEFSCNKK